MSDFVQRLELEQDELNGKINRLRAFQSTNVFAKLPDVERVLLTEQLEYMYGYNRLLVMRLEIYSSK